MKNSQQWLESLKQQGLITTVAVKDKQEQDPPWYIKTLMGFCGWLAAIFILGFLAVGMGSLFDNLFALSIVGTLMIAASYGLLSSSKLEFVAHLGLAVSFAGQALIAFALFEYGNIPTLWAWLLLTMLHAGLAMCMPSYIHAMLSAYFATFCLSFFMFEAGAVSYFSSLVLLVVANMWLREFTFSQQVRKLQSMAYGIVVGLVQFKTMALLIGQGIFWDQASLPDVNQWIDEGLNVLVLLFILQQLVRHKTTILNTGEKCFAAALVVLLCIGSFFAHGIVSSLLIIILGFATQNKILWVLGMLSAILNISAYYYLLDISLLDKSFILAGLGTTALLLAYICNALSNLRADHEN
ncbi:DUF4401 domain-containing protein [uncultured Paraglaciecola sp.]|mgnify:CR=1 FL=1|uniref:DUF4401 domain-containing protein n=1 Tax=uncultured Paraglaciecola sp. TaxID=1765024 RepID=UPI0026055EBB|nr:DUF4401 domain-containing protein [uncultured Paraglaciecola sp.]